MEKFIFFWKTSEFYGSFSNWYMVDFNFEGHKFNCSEQAMMYMKAKLFGDQDQADKISLTKDPASQKALGRGVVGFNESVWNAECKRIVYKVCRAKFVQNPKLLAILFSTQGHTLVEASPKDTIWGIGLDENHPDAMDRKKWRGKNWLGEVLTELRDDLLTGDFSKV